MKEVQCLQRFARETSDSFQFGTLFFKAYHSQLTCNQSQKENDGEMENDGRRWYLNQCTAHTSIYLKSLETDLSLDVIVGLFVCSSNLYFKTAPCNVVGRSRSKTLNVSSLVAKPKTIVLNICDL